MEVNKLTFSLGCYHPHWQQPPWFPSTWDPTTHFTNNSWAQNPNLAKIHIALIWKIIIQSSHNFAHAMTAQLSWHVQNYDLTGPLQLKIKAEMIPHDFDNEFMNQLRNGPNAVSCWVSKLCNPNGGALFGPTLGTWQLHLSNGGEQQ